jgi:hypothetical protein
MTALTIIEKIKVFAEEHRQTIVDVSKDVSIGGGSYLAILKLDWIQEAQHIITGLVTALVCCIGVHYLRKALAWFDGLFKSKKDGKN